MSVALAVLQRDLKLSFRYPLATGLRLLSALVSIYFVRLAADFALRDRGPDYFAYAAVGLVISSYLVRVNQHMAKFLREEQTIGTLEPVLGAPKPGLLIMLSMAAFPALEGAAVLGMQLAVATAFGLSLGGANWLVFAAVIIVSVVAFSGLGLISAAFVVVFKRGEPFAAAIATGSFLFAGVFFPPEVLPWALRWVSYALPLTYSIRLGRRALGVAEEPLTSMDPVLLTASACVLLPLGLYLVHRAVLHGRRTGSLCHY